nr:putative reverse transcriptase domain-containing protein [Tanacetum cinerariifolium]
MIDIHDDIDLVDYDEEDPEEEPEEDVDIELEDDAELIFPYVAEVWNKMFYLDMVRIGAVPKPPSDDEDTEHPRKKSKNSTFDGTERPSEPRGPPRESSFARDSSNGHGLAPIMSPKAVSEARIREIIRDQVTTSMTKFVANMNRGTGCARAGGVGAGGARVVGAEPAAPEITRCTYITFMKCEPHHFKGTEGAVRFCQWFEKLQSVFRISDCKERDKVKFTTATLQGRALTWWNRRIASMGIDAANGTPWTERTDIDGYTNRFHELALLCPRMVEPEQHGGDCWKCGKLGHKTAACWSLDIKDVTCFNCNEKGHRKRDCPKLKKNGQGGNNRGAVSKLRAVDAQQDPKVITELGSFDIIIGMNWLSRYDAAILCGEKKDRIPLEAQVSKQESKLKRLEDVSIIQDFPKELPGLSPPRQVEFCIDLIPSATPMARVPYHLAPSEMKELSEQLKELLEKSFLENT